MSMCMRSRKDKEKTSDLETHQKHVVREAFKIMYGDKYLLCPPAATCYPNSEDCYDCWFKWANKE